MATFVTDDSFLRPGANIDPDDQRVLDDAAADGDLKVVSSAEALELMEKEKDQPKPEPAEDEKPKKQVGIPLEPGDIEELGHAAAQRMAVFSAQIGLGMTAGRARFVRRLRCDEKASWRKVARQFYLLYGGDWEPMSNQLAGMALCQAAAAHFGESPREAPWN